ncbi:hypothetical protein [Noviherbaspirillum malthae]|uniref:hypothetical protein n=1 Tax=Noviherbaspirillum malthae TaxID=1260987 RepID=UPI00188F451B|nr:hypothetical protein [Noviherbaspirillum malthae]
MLTYVRRTLFASLLASTVGLAHAAPELLTDQQLDQISAGGQYSYVEGGGAVDAGSVDVKATTQAHEKPNGTTVTKAVLKVKAVGTDVNAAGYGESGANGVVSSGAGEGAVDEGKVVVRIKTVSKVQADGDVITKTKVVVRAVERPTRY